MEKTIMLLTMLISFLAINSFYAILPYISRKTLSFGISIPENVFNDPKLICIRKKYRNLIIFSGIISVTIIVFLFFLPTITSTNAAIITNILIFLNLLTNSWIYLRAHKQIKALKIENKWQQSSTQLITIETGFRNRKFKSSPLWFAIFLLIIATTIAISFLVYETIPEKIPLKFNISGQATNFVDKSYLVLLYIPLVQSFMTLVFVFIYYIISKAKQQIDPGNPQKTLQQSIIFRYRWSVFIIITGLLILVMLSLTQFTMIGLIKINLLSILTIVFSILITIAALLLSILTGQSGSRVKIKENEKRASIFRDDDSYWKLGILYYNPKDPSIFIEKRFGIGWTINFGRKASWFILLGFLVVTGGFILLSFLLAS